MITKKLAPPNSIILIMASDNQIIPSSMRESVISVTEFCICIGTLSELDGDTSVSICRALEAEESTLNEHSHKIFSGHIYSQDGKFGVFTSHLDKIIDVPCEDRKLKLTIMINDLREPDSILILH